MMSERALPTVMVIEPDVLMRAAISEYLRECGYRVIEAVRAEDVCGALKAGAELDVVFSELRLPGELQGFALAQSLRQKHPGIEVILTSGVTDAADKASALCGDGPVKKPYELDDIATRIRVLLERRRRAK
jgi:DNA-binding response OmpR family regulator